jgi:bacterioferritin (cytochrome b1)
MAEVMDLEAMAYGIGQPKPEEVSAIERLLNEFETHEAEEGNFLKRYKEIAEKSKNSAVRFLLQLILSDEEKHNAITHAMVSTLKGAVRWSRPKDALDVVSDLGAEKKELVDLTEGFLDLEKKGIKDYKKLLKESKGYYQGIFTLLIETMMLDSQKHIEILKFIRQRLKKA